MDAVTASRPTRRPDVQLGRRLAFTDDNGRIGRALVNTILRRRGITTNVVIPMASVIAARADRYFDLRGEYRDGRAAPIVLAFANASRVAALESLTTAQRLREIPQDWRVRLARVRSHSAIHQLLEAITTIPVLSADDAIKLVDAPTSRVYASIQRLVDGEILTPLTQSKRNQIWGAGDILDEL